jgi:hypothetical protein
MRSKIALTALILIGLSALPANARGPYGTIKIGNWSGGAFTHDTTGVFTACIASAPYKSGITVFVMVSANMTWNLGFSDNRWSVTPGTSFPIVLTFDGRPPINVNGRPVSKDTVSVDMPDNSAVISQFRQSRAMSAFAQGNLFQFTLEKTGILLPALVNCVQTINRDGISGAKDFVLPDKPPAAVSRMAPSSSPDTGSSLRPASGPSTPELQLEAVQLASNFIVKASLSNPRILSRGETPTTVVNNGAALRTTQKTAKESLLLLGTAN